MSTAKESKKMKQKRQLLRRRGVILVALLAVMILVVNLIVFSYSWFTPVSTTGVGLSLDTDSSLRSEKCTFSTYQGTLVTDSNYNSSITVDGVSTTYRALGYYIDQIVYDTDPIADNVEITIPRATTVNGEKVPGRVYFRTNVQNTDTEHPSVISLYHHKFPAELGTGVTFPSNTYFINEDTDFDDCFILRNAYVKRKDEADVDGPGLLQVEWFVENFSTTSTRTIRVTKQTTGVETPIEWLYLMYN